MKNKATHHLELPELSRIGFGCHLVSSKNKQHHEALSYALESGCNLIDTSANYMKGESEMLVADVLKETQLPAFIITKSGYHHSEAKKLSPLLQKISFNLIDPDFLSNRLAVSLSRLNGQVDAYLLHNPEYYFTQLKNTPSQDEFYTRIQLAFEFLEQQVAEKKIRYYGISSNTFPNSTEDEKVIRLKKIMELARKVSAAHHFRFIEFPFNLAETGALLPHQEGNSLLDIAHQNNLIVCSNRPLNAYVPEGALRLAYYPAPADQWEPLIPENDHHYFDAVLELLCKELVLRGEETDLMKFMIIKKLSQSWMNIGNPAGVTELFEDYFYPFVKQVYSRRIPAQDRLIFGRFYQKACHYAAHVMHKRSLHYYEKWLKDGLLDPEDNRRLPVQACDYYLRSGINHVLTGMRNKNYTDEMKSLFFTGADNKDISIEEEIEVRK